jgi:hypothetical protein
MALRAIRKCWHNKHKYEIGEEWLGAEGEAAPRHFVQDKDFSTRAVEKARQEEKLKRVAIKAQKAAEAGGPTGGVAKKP